MKRGFVISFALIFSFAAVLSLSACSRQEAGSTGSQAVPGGWDRRRPDFGQPEKPADIRGVVKSIMGNAVTVLKIDLPGAGRRTSSTAENVDIEKIGNKEGVTGGAAITISTVAGGPGGMPGGRISGGPGGMPGGPGETGTTDRAAQMAALKELSTGEETIIVPVGIRMMKSSLTDEKKMEMVEASLTDITADKMITVWLNASVTDKKVAEFVLIN